MKNISKEIAIGLLIWICILIYNYYFDTNTLIILFYLVSIGLIIANIFKFSNSYRTPNPTKQFVIISSLLFLIVVTFFTKNLNRVIFKSETAVLKPIRQKAIKQIKEGTLKSQLEYRISKPFQPSFPKISWYNNEIMLDNLNKESFRVRFFLPNSAKNNYICLVYSEDEKFNTKVEQLIKTNDYTGQHEKIEPNWYLTNYHPKTTQD